VKEIPVSSGTYHLLRFELSQVATDRRFVLGLIIQVALMAVLVPVLIGYAQSVGTGGDVLQSRARGFAPVALWGARGTPLEAVLTESDRITVERMDSREGAIDALRSGYCCMAIGMPEGPSADIEAVVNIGDPRSASAWSVVEIAESSLRDSQRRSTAREIVVERIGEENESQDADIESLIEEEINSFLEPVELVVVRLGEGADATLPGGNEPDAEDEGGTSSPQGSLDFLTMIFLSFGLCFPLLSGSGMVIESLTGEKELRTIEGVLGTPITRGQMLLGKVGSAYIISLVQVLALLLVLSLILRVQNLPQVFLILVTSGAAIVSSTALVSTVSKTVKEAQLAITIVYVFIFVLFFGPILLPGPAAWISPFTPLTRYAAGEPVDLANALIPLAGCVLFSVLSLWICARLLRNDGIIFGPRPSLRDLLRESVARRAGTGNRRLLLAAGFGAAATLPSMVFPSVLLVPSFALIGFWSLPIALLLAATVEEYFKPYAIYLMEPVPSRNEVIMMGLVSGLAFAAVENALFTGVILGSGVLDGWIIVMRYAVAPLLHAGLTVLVSYGFWKGGNARAISLVAASILHFFYNLSAVVLVV